MRKRQLLALCSLAVSLCACSTTGIQPRRPYDTNQQLGKLLQSFDPETIRSCEAAGDKICRDKIVREQVEAYDIVFVMFEDAITKTSQQTHVVGDILVSVFTGAGTVIKGSQAKSIVSALAAAVTGTKNSLDTNLLFQKSITTVTSRMESLRKESLVTLREGLLKPVSQYPLTQALMDVEEYFKTGSMQRAIASIDQVTEETSQGAEARKNEMLKLAFGEDDNSAILRKFWKPNGTIDQENAEALRAWIDDNVQANLSITAFIYGGEYANERQQAVSQLITQH